MITPRPIDAADEPVAAQDAEGDLAQLLVEARDAAVHRATVLAEELLGPAPPTSQPQVSSNHGALAHLAAPHVLEPLWIQAAKAAGERSVAEAVTNLSERPLRLGDLWSKVPQTGPLWTIFALAGLDVRAEAIMFGPGEPWTLGADELLIVSAGAALLDTQSAPETQLGVGDSAWAAAPVPVVAATPLATGLVLGMVGRTPTGAPSVSASGIGSFALFTKHLAEAAAAPIARQAASVRYRGPIPPAVVGADGITDDRTVWRIPHRWHTPIGRLVSGGAVTMAELATGADVDIEVAVEVCTMLLRTGLVEPTQPGAALT